MSYNIFFRGGEQRNQLFELLHKSLNNSLGTGFNAEEGSIIWCLNYAIAKEIALAYEITNKFTNQLLPLSMNIFLERWEKILKIVPPSNATLTQRRNIVSKKFAIWNKPPTQQNVADLIEAFLDGVFIRLDFNKTTSNRGKFPGGLSIPGGVTLQNGNWSSNLSTIKVRIWQPRDKNNNLLMDDFTFKSLRNSFDKFLSDYLPAYVDFKHVRFVNKLSGTVTIPIGSKNVVGTGTSFTTKLTPGREIEIVDDVGRVNIFYVNNITDNTHMTITSPCFHGVTDGSIYIGGFFLDTPSNLDNQTFAQ